MTHELRNSTRCKCGHVWAPLAWDTRRNCTCPACGAWNQVGKDHPLYLPPGTRALQAAITRAMKKCR